jgi:hypothetical protein
MTFDDVIYDYIVISGVGSALLGLQNPGKVNGVWDGRYVD